MKKNTPEAQLSSLGAYRDVFEDRLTAVGEELLEAALNKHRGYAAASSTRYYRTTNTEHLAWLTIV